MEEFGKFFGLAFSALLPLVNPLGDALVFLGLVGRAPSAVYRSLAKKIAISTALFLITIEVIGTAMLRFFGISLPVVQVAGGLTLAAMGWGMLNKERADTKQEAAELDDHAIGSLTQRSSIRLRFRSPQGPGASWVW